MTGHCSTPVSPDGITGMIFAMEGIRGCVTLLNGPMGCRFYHSTTSQFLSIHPMLYLPSQGGVRVPVDYNHLDNWFFRQQRVPCTYLDGDDYVFGSIEKVRDGLNYLRDNIHFEMLAVVNSPGASLIGDRLADVIKETLPGRDTVMLESPGFSEGFDRGYEQACLQLLRQICFSDSEIAADSREKGELPAVNVLGLSIWNRYFEGDREELAGLFEDCGISVNCFLGADCSCDEIRQIPRAELNVVLDPDRGLETAGYLEERFGTPYYVCDTLPIGFDAVEKMFSDISRILGTDPVRVLEKSRKARALAWYKINGIYQSCGLPQGALFSIAAECRAVLSYSAFLMEYLGMIPDVLTVTGQMQPSGQRKLRELLEKNHALQALEKPMTKTRAELVFSDANWIGSLMSSGRSFCGIEISLPGMGYTDLVKKSHMGITGALFLTEQVLNGLMTRL